MAKYVGAMVLFGAPLFLARNVAAKADTGWVGLALRRASILLCIMVIMMPMTGIMTVSLYRHADDAEQPTRQHQHENQPNNSIP